MSSLSVIIGMLFVPMILLIKRRVFDFFSVFCFANALFFLPVLVGEISGPPGYPSMVIEDAVYISFALTQSVILLFAILADLYVGSRVGSASYTDNSASRKHAWSVFLIGCLVVLALFDLKLLSFSTKREMMDNAGMKLQASMAICLGISLYGFIFGNKKLKAFSFLLIGFTAFVGFRSYMAIFLVSIFLHWFLTGGKKVFLVRAWFFCLAPVLVFILSLVKPVYASLKNGNILTVSEYVEKSFSSMEFLKTQYIFNEVVRNDFSLEIGHFFYSLLAIFPVPLEYYGFSSSRFNELFQGALFPDVAYGMAYNPWAEGYAWLGLFGVFVYVFLFCSLLMFLRVLMFKTHSRDVYVLSVIVGVYVSFYLHRNSLASELALVRNVLYPFVFLIFLKNFSLLLISRKRLGGAHE